MNVVRIWNSTSPSFMIGLILSLGLAGCTRAPDEVSKISVSIPKKMMTSMSSGDELSHVVINVSGPSISNPILKTYDSCDDCVPARTIPSTVELEIPSGDNRLIQVLAVYRTVANHKMTFYYGDKKTNLSPGTVSVPIAVSKLGNASDVISSRVAGRILSAPNVGPTGDVSINYNPGNGKPNITIERSSIINGWFSFFMLAGADLEYVVEQTGQKLFNGGAINVENPMFNVSPRVMKVVIPTSKREETYSGVSTHSPEEAQFYVWGFFGDSATIAPKKVCYDISTAPVRLKKFDNLTQLLTIQTLAGEGSLPSRSTLLQTTGEYIYALGGVQAGNTGCEPPTITNDIYTNLLKVETAYFDGNGHDYSAGFFGPFTRNAQGNPFTVTDLAGFFKFQGNFLPGVYPIINTAYVYKRSSPFAEEFSLDSEDVRCSDIKAGAFGFRPAGQIASDGSGNINLTSTITTAEGAAGVSAVVCVGNAVGPLGRGIFVDPWYFGGGGMPGGGMGMGPPAKISYHGPLAANINSCTEGDIVLLNASDSESSGSLNTSGISINLSGTGGLTFLENGCGGSAVSTLTVPVGSSRVRVGILTGGTTSNSTVSFNYLSGFSSALTNYAESFAQVPAGGPTQLHLVAAPSGMPVPGLITGACTEMKFKAKKSDMAPAAFSGNGVVALTGFGVDFYQGTDSGCVGSVVTSVPFSDGLNESDTFRVKASGAAWVNVTGEVTGHLQSSFTWSFSGHHGLQAGAAGVPMYVDLTTSGTPLISGCLQSSVMLKDAGGNPVPAPAAITVNLTSSSASPFYSMSGCSGGNVTSVSIGAGSSSASFYYRLPAAAGPWDFQAAGTFNSIPFYFAKNGMLTAQITISDPGFNFGTISYPGTSAPHLFTLNNIGVVTATTLSSGTLPAGFNWVGGTFPGTGGNCGPTLAMGGSCTIEMEYSPTSDSAMDSGYLFINYHDGASIQSPSIQIFGAGSP